MLESKTTVVQNQRWLHVKTADGTVGWLSEDHLLTPIKLATEAILKRDVAVRAESVAEAIKNATLKKGAHVLILEVSGSWVRTQPLPAAEHAIAWVPTETLETDFNAQTFKAFVPKPASVYVMPAPKASARKLGSIKEGSFTQVLKRDRDWLEIPFSGGVGHVHRTDVVMIDDLQSATAQELAEPLVAPLPLRSSPLPYSDVVKNLGLGTKLTITGSTQLRWGQVKISGLGLAWWPISEDAKDDHEPEVTRLHTRELFNRKIFDMAANPAKPTQKFVSAQGVFRTLDGEQWSKIPLFKDENHPIAITSRGPVFVGPFASEDHGETFQSWIRWDSLIATLKSRYRVTPQGLRIIEIRPEDSFGRKVTLRLDIGYDKPIKVFTPDQGQTWQAL